MNKLQLKQSKHKLFKLFKKRVKLFMNLPKSQKAKLAKRNQTCKLIKKLKMLTSLKLNNSKRTKRIRKRKRIKKDDEVHHLHSAISDKNYTKLNFILFAFL